jgi:hypothetical protein
VLTKFTCNFIIHLLKQIEQNERHWEMDKVMERLKINLVEKMVQQASLLYSAMLKENMLLVVMRLSVPLLSIL